VSTPVAQILRDVERLSERERVELRRALVEQTPMSDELTDEDFAALAEASFRALDEEEQEKTHHA
jgi:ABC-type thiamine transport system ATPase subunit